METNSNMIRMDKLIQIFADTQEFYSTDELLKSAVEFGLEHTKLYSSDEYPELPDVESKLGMTLTLNVKSFQAAMKFHRAMPDKKIAVLNFASATHPGGGVLSGSRAQEESLCRCSTLYPLINQQWLKDKYYVPNREANDFRYTDDCIYSRGVVICKTDTDFPERLEHDDFISVDVVTCAAPNLKRVRQRDYNVRELYQLHYSRARHILHIAALNEADILITGAFGCGAFKNDPELVAEAWSKALKEYQRRFEYIIFAVYFRDYEVDNFRVFNEKFNLS